MSRNVTYIPILKAKSGEFSALKEASPFVKENIIPVIELLPDKKPSWFADALVQAIQLSQTVFIDPRFVDKGDVAESEGLLEATCSLLRRKGIRAIPVVSARPSAWTEAQMHTLKGRPSDPGLCMRIGPGQLRDFSAAEATVNRLGAGPESVDLIVDLGFVPESEPSILAAQAVIDRIPHLNSWLTLTLAAGSFPETLSTVEKDSSARFRRLEWEIWKEVSKGVRRVPVFGDYGINHVKPPPKASEYLTISPQIRYTCAEDWLVLKGHTVRSKDGYQGIFELCRQLVEHAEYRGPGFSWGDQWIMSAATERKAPGNATTWRKVGTSHHLAHVVDQIANLP